MTSTKAASAVVARAGYLARRRRHLYDRIIRVNLAGELGADRIYAGQMAVLRQTDVGPVVQHMWDQEKKHLAKFEHLSLKHRVPQSLFSSAWSAGGFIMGATSALINKKAAMACTVAVEKVITEHYDSQIRKLYEDDPEIHKEMIETISEFRDEEQEHHDTGISHDAEQAPFYRVLSKVTENVCRVAIKIAERV